ncbi:Rv3235 family protein, partial [Streptomyces sp. NTH33]|uniref:Rv3235 family protein n=1 Tax=Streptomyces sp. NTH33 TaxID=1735453 RepID=UPI0021AD1A77
LRTAPTRPPTAPGPNGARSAVRTVAAHTAGGPRRTARATTPAGAAATAAETHAPVARGTALAVDAQAALRAASLPVATDLFADRLLAVLSGQRPVHWMLRHTAGRAYDELAWLAERGALRTRGARPVVRDIGYYEPRAGAVEAFARIGAGDQLRAMAFRLEQGRDRRWRCTAVELGGPRMPHSDDELP